MVSKKPSEGMQKLTLAAFAAALMGSASFTPTTAVAAPLPTCSQLAALIAAMPDVVQTPLATTSSITAAVVGPPAHAAFCNVFFTVSTTSGPAGGYLPGQKQQIEMEFGLPLSAADGGSGGGADGNGAWNGRIENVGGGGYAGAIISGTSIQTATDAGYAGGSNDTGHEGGGGTFALNPDDSLATGLINDFAFRGIHQETIWSKKLVKLYYGKTQKFTYWNGCSTGGRQGHQQAQNFPDDYDGILAGAPAFNWDRFIVAEQWGPIVQNAEGAELTSNQLTDIVGAVIKTCDGLDGILDGILQDPRQCLTTADNYVCGQPGVASLTSAADCLTPQQASAFNKLWDGPPGPTPDTRLWFGLERGAFLQGLDTVTAPFSISVQYLQYWVYQDPAFDWTTLNEKNFKKAFALSEQKFHKVIGTDNPDLSAFKAHGGKMIIYHGLADFLIMPRGSYNYYNRVTKAMGGIAATQSFYRFFPFPGNSHCGGTMFQTNSPLIDSSSGGAMFQGLVNWVEHGSAPDQLPAVNSTNGQRFVCKYPEVLQQKNAAGVAFDPAGTLAGAGSNFQCGTQSTDEFQSAETAVADPGPQGPGAIGP